MSKHEWIEYRSARSETPWKAILASGFDAVPCDCAFEGCLGWRLMFVGVTRANSARAENPELAA